MIRELSRLTGIKLKTEHIILGAIVIVGLAIAGHNRQAYSATVTVNSLQQTPEIIRLNPIQGVSSIAAAGDFNTSSASVAVTNLMKNRQLILPLGDYNYTNTHGADYAVPWYSQLWNNYTGYILPNLGNHDNQESSFYLSLFGIPGWSYSVDIGGVHLLVLNTENPVSGAAIDMDLSNAKKKGKMLIVSFHIPLKGKTTSKDAYFWRDLPEWQAAFDKNRVELILNGHSHFYERFNTSVSPGGTTYVIVGTGGATTQNTTMNSSVAKQLLNTFGYLRISVHSGYLECKFVDINGSIKDVFNVYRSYL